MKEKTTIPGESDEFGMASVKEVKRVPNKVKEVDEVNNMVELD